MMMVDSSVWIDYFNGKPSPACDFLDGALSHRFIITGDLILTEVLQGFKHQKEFNQAKELLTSLEVRNLLSQGLAIKSANNYRFLRRQGITIRKTIDVIIATYCLEHHFSLLHSDKDFIPFSELFGLTLYPPTDENPRSQ